MDDLLLLLYFEGNTTEEETQQVSDWLESDNENMKYYLYLCRLHETNIWYEKPRKDKLFSLKRKKQKSLGIEIFKIVAFFALVFVLSQWLKPLYKEDPKIQTMHVPAGQTAQLYLADGSKVWLSAGSTLNFPTHFSGNSRQVTLKGEGFFEVKANKKNPFIVLTSKYKIKALGTSFNVRAYEEFDKFETSLLTGSVEITNHNNLQVALLHPNEQITVINNKLAKNSIENTDYFLWREGILSFDEPLNEVLEKLEVYFDVIIQVNNSEITKNKKHCTGKFRTRDGLRHILDVLQTTNYFQYEMNEDKNLITIN